MMTRSILSVFSLLFIIQTVCGQTLPLKPLDSSLKQPNHSMDMMHMPGMHHNADTAGMEMDPGMSHAYSLHLPMNRNGSGTGWLPDNAPMYGSMIHQHKWMYMIHGNLFLRYNKQDLTGKGSRGNEKFDTPDWLMLMAQRQVGKNGLFHFSSMFSLDAITGGNGYPLLFQSGEAYNGKPIVDRQHPHDLFSGLSVAYTQAFSAKTDVYVYLGYPGEPALGPVAFMHRPSSLENPNAPLTHHWTDATHITFGVATVGIRYGQVKLEGSSFTGREPDSRRYNFDRPRFDSWSTRLSLNPSPMVALKVSYGFIKSPEALRPQEDVHRTTASAIFSKALYCGPFNAVLLWGMNKTKDVAAAHAFLAEASQVVYRTSLYTRYEWVQKSSEELNLDQATYGNTAFAIQAFTLGANYRVLSIGNVNLALGGQMSIYHAPAALDQLYGHYPLAAEVYLRFYPGRIMMAMMKM